MGGCLGKKGGPSTKEVAGYQNVRKHKGSREATWQQTGIVGLVDARLNALPAAVYRLGSVATVVNATNNSISTLSPEIGSLTALKKLHLGHNSLATLPAALASCTKLQLLDLSYNRALAALPDGLAALAQLRTLKLRGCALRALPDSIGALRELQSLDVSDQEGRALRSLPDSIGGCANLEELLCGNNSIEVLPVAIGRLQRLKTLDVRNNHVTEVSGDILSHCGALQLINLHDNPISAAVFVQTPGYAEFEARRKQRFDKVIEGGALLGPSGLDEGFKRDLKPQG
ncbi:unnamed protein product [Pedinophyceae sp. YPF-701]|nr:unnamed protein product [Pedinophyceae sp. YPF-701]